MPAFPVDLRVAGARTLVVGGGRVAARRAVALLHCGAQVTVVSPRLCTAVAQQHAAAALAWWPREFRTGDCAGFDLVLGCANDSRLASAIAGDARAHGALVNVADAPGACDFFIGAVARRGGVTVSVHTDGRAPGMASRLRDEIAAVVDDRAAERTERFAELRRRLRVADTDPGGGERRAEFLARYTEDEALDGLRAPGAIDRALCGYGRPPAGANPGNVPVGKVFLVGAGPGDPDLMTVRAARLVRSADALVVDALVPEAAYAATRARVFGAGKRAGRPRVTQEEIHHLIIELARGGNRVVRLKGGDPGLFARLDEERAALAAAGVPYEVVPGVTSALAAPGAVGVTASARGVADRVVIVTGHRCNDAPPSAVDVPAYRPDQTLVILMGLLNLDGLVEALLVAGYPRDLPAVVIGRATLPDQAHVAAPLGQLVERVTDSPVPAPATIVVGWVTEGHVAGQTPPVDRKADAQWSPRPARRRDDACNHGGSSRENAAPT